MMGTNYYVKTFIGKVDEVVPDKPQNDLYWTYHKYNDRRYTLTWVDMKRAIDNIRKFHLILVLDWINDNTTKRYVESSVGWKNSLPRQVLPHESQAIRADKHSKKASQVIPPQDLITVQKENVFDMLFFEITRRIVLERIHCGN
jgi:hypothetical protein